MNAESSYKLIPFTLSHVESLRSFFSNHSEISQWAGPNFRYPHTTQTFLEDLRYQELSSYSLINDSGELLAFGQYYQRLIHCHLGRLVVNPQLRGLGLAKVLIKELSIIGQKDLCLSSLSLFVLDNNKPAKNLYKTLGFKEKSYPEELPLNNFLYLIRENL